ncbi:MAG: hypothetical protein ACXVJD_03130 [Mucilaginibacter sp.]
MIEIKPYNGDLLCDIFYEANLKKTPRELISPKVKHINFLMEYLGSTGLKANFYIAEKEYISVDYLTDYSFYYSKNFTDYGNKCVRLHFFSYKSENQTEFENAFWDASLNHDNAQLGDLPFWDDYYLGFIVIRPIPKFMVGYTILKHYNYKRSAPSYDSERNYWAIKPYEVHVFGSKVRLDSLAFLSQDSNVAACATIAVWTVLQRAVENYYINLKSPYEITKDVGLTIHDGNRIFPNNGLNASAICNAITKSNLAPEFRIVKDLAERNMRVQIIVHAYSRVRLPVILGIQIKVNGKFGKHAVAVNGHRMQSYQPAPIKKTRWLGSKKPEAKLILRSSNINELYVHDDQWGPFSRFKLIAPDKFSTSWNEQTKDKDLGEVLTVVIPVFQKVRIPVEDIEGFTLGMNQFMQGELAEELKGEINWDIQLYFSADFKNEVRNALIPHVKKPVFRELVKKLLTEPLPKYIWVTTLYTDDNPLMQFIHDATGLRHTTTLLFAFSYLQPLGQKFIERVCELQEIANTNARTKSELQVLFKDSIPGFIKKISWFNPQLP